ncbi:hypothetical protein AY600_17965 [Phormidium willei BDU 130791]|nr:hypothetical protein AY600_17965 [Phormidium willei BDU 130791]
MGSDRHSESATSGQQRPLTRELRAQMAGEMQRSGSKVSDFEDVIAPATLTSWLNGAADSADDETLRAVLEALRALPTKDPGHCGTVRSVQKVKITPAIRKHLNAERERTQIGVHKLLRGRKDVPKGLYGALIAKWLKGTVTHAPRHHIRYVEACWAECESVAELTPEVRNALYAETERTGRSWSSFMESLDSPPPGLDASKLSRWASGYSKYAPASLLEWVLDQFAALPDKEPPSSRKHPYISGRSQVPEDEEAKDLLRLQRRIEELELVIERQGKEIRALRETLADD